MDNTESNLIPVRQKYQLIVDWFSRNGGREKNGSPKIPEVTAPLPPAATAKPEQIRLVAGLLKDDVLVKYAKEKASNGVALGKLAEEVLQLLDA
jgi:hypothetical protein